jgi:endonuclease/exonuclease/phosphatase family metal-dependent hydrolase
MAKQTDPQRILREWRAEPAIASTDLFLLQEVAEPDGVCIAADLAASLGMHVVCSPSEPGQRDQSLAILSRYPILESHCERLKTYNLVFRSRQRFALSATIDAPGRPIRVINAHLDTRVNIAARLEQLGPAIRAAANFSGPRLIAGDFNSNDFYWLGHVLPLPWPRVQSGQVEDFMRKHGFRSALTTHTPTFDFLGQRLDWVFLNGFESSDTHLYPVAFSDHHALWTRLKPCAAP